MNPSEFANLSPDEAFKRLGPGHARLTLEIRADDGTICGGIAIGRIGPEWLDPSADEHENLSAVIPILLAQARGVAKNNGETYELKPSRRF